MTPLCSHYPRTLRIPCPTTSQNRPCTSCMWCRYSRQRICPIDLLPTRPHPGSEQQQGPFQRDTCSTSQHFCTTIAEHETNIAKFWLLSPEHAGHFVTVACNSIQRQLGKTTLAISCDSRYHEPGADQGYATSARQQPSPMRSTGHVSQPWPVFWKFAIWFARARLCTDAS